MKNSRSLIVLLMVFIALVALLVYQNQRQNAAAAQNLIPGTNPVFNDFRTDDIQAIRLRSPETGESFVVSRSSDGMGIWTAPESSGTLVTAEAENIARTMVLLPYSGTLAMPESAALAGFGFTPEGVLSVEILLVDGSSHIVAVGYRTPTEDNYYALVDERETLYLLNRPPVDYLISRLKSPPIA